MQILDYQRLGTYILFQKGVPVYVGSSQNALHRVGQGTGHPLWDQCFIIPSTHKDLARILEHDLRGLYGLPSTQAPRCGKGLPRGGACDRKGDHRGRCSAGEDRKRHLALEYWIKWYPSRIF